MDDHVCLICGIESKTIPCLGCERNELRLKLDVATSALQKISHIQSCTDVAVQALEILGLRLYPVE